MFGSSITLCPFRPLPYFCTICNFYVLINVGIKIKYILILTASDLIFATFTVCFVVTLPPQWDAAVVRASTLELCLSAVGSTCLLVGIQDKVSRTLTGIGRSPGSFARCQETQVGASPVVIGTRVRYV